MAITNTPKRFCAPTALTSVEATLYTAPSGSGLTAIVRNIEACNTSGADRQITVAIGVVATAANCLLYNLVVPANDALSLDVYIGMNTAETLRAICTLSGGVTITVTGVE